jgi:hypothetical protein
MDCRHCEKCLKKNCNVYRSERLSKAYNELLDTIGKDFGLYKLIEWLNNRLKYLMKKGK